MNSTKPYLIRAFYEWIVDNECTPHLVVDANFPDVEVPREFVEAGRIVLNIAMSAVRSLELGQEAVSFQARFGGVPHSVYVPVEAVVALYARENGRGMVFSAENEPPLPPDEIATVPKEAGKGSTKGKGGKGKGKGSHLTVVK